MKGAYFEKVAEMIDLQMDVLRILKGEEPETNLGKKFLLDTIEDNDMSRFQRFKIWARENLLGLAVSITIGGIITTIIITSRNTIESVGKATWSLGKSVVSIAKSLGPIIGGLFTLLGTALSWMSSGILFLGDNLWLLFVLFMGLLSRRKDLKKFLKR